MSDKLFDPSRFIRPIKTRQGMADYLPVAARLAWLRHDHPDACIETEMVAERQDEVVFRARITIPGGGSATGWGSETRADFPQGHLEKSETKSLGRALAALGYGTLQAGEELDEGERVVDTPQPTPAGPELPSPFASVAMSEPEFGTIRVLLSGMIADGLATSEIVREMNVSRPRMTAEQFDQLREDYAELMAARRATIVPPDVTGETRAEAASAAPAPATPPPFVSQPSNSSQQIAVRALLEMKRLPDEAVTAYVIERFGYLGSISDDFHELTHDQARDVIDWLQRKGSRNPAHQAAQAVAR